MQSHDLYLVPIYIFANWQISRYVQAPAPHGSYTTEQDWKQDFAFYITH